MNSTRNQSLAVAISLIFAAWFLFPITRKNLIFGLIDNTVCRVLGHRPGMPLFIGDFQWLISCQHCKLILNELQLELIPMDAISLSPNSRASYEATKAMLPN